jgi:hypothetical protein
LIRYGQSNFFDCPFYFSPLQTDNYLLYIT